MGTGHRMIPARTLNHLSLAAVVGGLGALWFGLVSPHSFDILFALAMGNLVLALLPRIGIGGRMAKIAALTVPAMAIAVILLFPEVRLAPYLAIAMINGFVAYAFGHGLVVGHEPLVLQIIRISKSGPEGPREFQSYVTQQCRIWTAFGGVTALVSIVAMISPASRTVLDPVLAALFVIQIVWFILSHEYARRRYRRTETAMVTIRAMSSPATWSALRI